MNGQQQRAVVPLHTIIAPQIKLLLVKITAHAERETQTPSMGSLRLQCTVVAAVQRLRSVSCQHSPEQGCSLNFKETCTVSRGLQYSADTLLSCCC